MHARAQHFGIGSLLTACLAWAGWPLVAVIGPAIGCVAVPLGLTALVAGLIGLVMGIKQRNALAVVTGIVGLSAIAGGAWLVCLSIMHF